MNSTCTDIIRRHAHELEPIPTGVVPKLSPLPGIRAVLFDIYGTLIVSGCGEVGTAVEQSATNAIREAFHEVGLSTETDPQQVLTTQREVIQDVHARLRGQGIDHPEVDIVEVWRETLGRLRSSGAATADSEHVDLNLLAVAYESRTNPVWPMPHARECLTALQSAGISLGIVSNAQFFTPLLFPVLFSEELKELGFDESLCFYSWRYALAKPSEQLFGFAVGALRARGISPEETLYVGNDMLNDVTGAARAGFRTALFAGDQRSLRLREPDPRVRGIVPDLVLTDFSQMPSCVAT